ncbi:MAG: cation diffusion facilitator family transporter [Fuerstiella sp.]|jgi:solute carrier family 30 (zinc transporter), member 9|nr:cation diffusion facilitator family transporter [Fuerstiella sp.]
MAGPETSKSAVVTAIVGNACVMCAKFVAYFATGSGAILSEAIHTFADLLNQILLLVGIKRSANDANENYAYGYGAERYIWALISAVGIFFLGCGVTVYHGISSLVHAHKPVSEFGWAVGVLVVSFLIEFYVLTVAVRSVRKSAAGQPFFAYLRREADPAVVAVVLEDAAACVGILIAFAAIGLTWLTGDQYWDAIGSITIGILLGCIACWLIQRNRSLLVGESVPPHIRAQLLKILNENPTVEEVVDLRTRILDTSTYRIKADIHFDGSALAEQKRHELRGEYEGITSYDEFETFAIRYADEIVDLLADEVDKIERNIRNQIPQAEHMDLEAD